ncbi:MAG TPA: glycoside hydrolase family protein [Caulobacteraceae bacterium]
MTPRHRASPAAIALIKRFEGLRLTAAQLDDGRWTIGYGHTRSAREGAVVTEVDADALLAYDLLEVQAAINDLTYTPLTQNQFDALACFVSNIGVEAFRHSSVLRRINEGALLQAACAMEMWRKAEFEGERIVIDALVRRRATEKALFLTPEDGFMAAPSAILQPMMDPDVGAAVPRVRQAELKTSIGAAATPIGSQPDARPEESPSPSERAAAAVTARLKAILPEEPAANEPEPFPAQPTPLEPARAEGAEAARASVRSIFDQTRDEPERAGIGPLIVLGLIGLSLFAGGLYWAFVSRPSGGLIGSPVLGFALGFLGIVCVGSAAYFLVERLGGDSDHL